jgi:hypothetical protein
LKSSPQSETEFFGITENGRRLPFSVSAQTKSVFVGRELIIILIQTRKERVMKSKDKTLKMIMSALFLSFRLESKMTVDTTA